MEAPEANSSVVVPASWLCGPDQVFWDDAYSWDTTNPGVTPLLQEDGVDVSPVPALVGVIAVGVQVAVQVGVEGHPVEGAGHCQGPGSGPSIAHSMYGPGILATR